MEGGNENKQAFLLVPPSHVLETYSIEVSKEDVDFLSLQSTEDALIFNIVTYGPNQTMTVNLKGPILVNRHTMVAKQVVPKNAAALATTPRAFARNALGERPTNNWDMRLSNKHT